MSSNNTTHTLTIASGETVAVNFSNATFPLSYILRPQTGATVSREGSNSATPGNRYVAPAQRASVASSASPNYILAQEQVPVSWAKFASSGGETVVEFCGDVADLQFHSSVSDTVSALTHDGIAVEVGETKKVALSEFFTYPKGALDVELVNSDATKATAEFDSNSGYVIIDGVAAGTATLSFTAKSPAEVSASASVTITVS